MCLMISSSPKVMSENVVSSEDFVSRYWNFRSSLMEKMFPSSVTAIEELKATSSWKTTSRVIMSRYAVP